MLQSLLLKLSRAKSIEKHKPTQNHDSNGKGLTHLELMLDNSQNDRDQHAIGEKVIKENIDPKISSTKHLDDEKNLSMRQGNNCYHNNNITLTDSSTMKK